jgi:hypothetical protein
MATNSAGKLLDTSGELFVDFVWGNFPMQPDDDRQTSPTQTVTVGGDQNVSWTNYGTKASARLDRTLSFHDIEATAYSGYPAYTENTDGAYVSGTAYAVVPNLVGLTEAAATDALLDAGLVKGSVTTSTVGYVASPSNAGKVKTQSVAAAAASIAFGTAVNLVLFSAS